MIESLSLWLQKIILLILIATFLDMLLPNSSMQRYVKLVMGLIILLSIITPIMQIFQKDLSTEKIAMRIMNMGSDSGQDWNELKQLGEKLMKQNDEEAMLFVKGQMETLISAKVEEQYGVTVLAVEISLQKEMDKEQAYPVLSSVQLILDKDIQATGQGENTDKNPIEPVTIQVGGESSRSAPLLSTSPELSAAERKLLNDIANDVAHTWSIDRSQVVATMEGK